MSVCNVAFEADTVRLLTDTMTYRDEKPVALERHKTEVAPSGRFAWACRGNVYLGNVVDCLLNEAGTIDEVEAQAAKLEPLIDPDIMALCKNVEITAAGWSDQRNDLRLIRIRIRPAVFEVAEIGRGVYMAPAPEASRVQLPATVTDDQFIRLALAQWKVQGKFKAPLCIGGVMHQTTVSRAGVERRMVALYPDYDAHAAKLGDPNAEEVRAFRAQARAAA
ncbi:hypothetical protein [Azospirillum argentinense]